METVFLEIETSKEHNSSSNATFGNGVGELPFSDVITNFDESRIVEYCAVTRTGGTEQLVREY